MRRFDSDRLHEFVSNRFGYKIWEDSRIQYYGDDYAQATEADIAMYLMKELKIGSRFIATSWHTSYRDHLGETKKAGIGNSLEQALFECAEMVLEGVK